VGSSHGAEGARAGEKERGTLILAGVPIGRPEDASARLAAELARADVVAAEDTRRVRRLAAELNVQISGRVVAYYDVIEARRAEELVKALEDGKDVLVVTDAGMPGVSDPGYRVVTAAAQAGMRVTAIPGPSALTTALAVSGLPTDRFCFEGFPPRKPGERQARFTELAADPRTQVFFESPRRVHATLRELSASHGPDRAAVVCRELTKVHEEIRRGTLAGLTEWADPEGPAQRGGGGGGGGASSGGVRGEITLVVAGIGTAAAKAAARDVAREARRAARFAARGARETSRDGPGGDSATGDSATGDTATGDTATGDTVSLDRGAVDD
jgi:16S rRNA (cytidine1402-2'-O)-methyltransferase